MMKKWWKSLLVVLAVAVSGFVGVIASGEVYAEDDLSETAKVGASFRIYAKGAVCTSMLDQRTGQWSQTGECPQGDAGSVKIVHRGNGKWGIEDGSFLANEFAKSIKVRTNNDQLIVSVKSFCEEEEKATVNFDKSLSVFVDRVNSQLTGKRWESICGGGTGNYNGALSDAGLQMTYTIQFSVKDVTDPEEIEEIENPAGQTVETTDPSGDGVKKTCMNSGGANTLGWIVCPLLDWMSDASQTLYDGFVEPALQVDPKLFTGGPNDGTREGWEIFRNISNVVFIILFLFVIFSQLTGVGIDNYGIKKILPKLILAAILINLSYWICLVFIDLSNIVGNSIQQLFDYMGSGLSMSSDAYQIDLTASLGATALTSVALLGIIAVGIWSVIPEGVGGILLVLVVAAISVIVSLFFLFILLAAREAAIVVLTVLSPLAFVCFMLPNTKNLFDKWWKLGEALLLVYPIAGLLVGGGNFVSQLLLVAGAGSGSFFSAFVAMIIGVVPIFFIPTVLKNSFQGLGNLGAKISGLGKAAGSRLSGTTDKAVRGSERFKNYQADRSRQRKIDAAKRTAARYTDENGNVRAGLSDRQKRALAQAQSIQLSEEAEEARRRNLLNGGYEAAVAGIEANAADEMVKNEEALIMNNPGLRDNIGELQSRLEAAISAGDGDKIMAYQNVLSKKGDAGREAVRQAMVNAQSNGSVSAGAAQTYASNLMNNWAGDYKDNNRSTYDYASAVLGGNDAATLGQSDSASLGSLKTSQVANMDDGEFERLKAQHVQYDNQGNITHVDDDFAKLCYNTLQDTNATTGAKQSRMEAISQFAEGSQQHAAANAPSIISHGAYEAPDGNVYHLREMNNGKFLDDNDFEVDITHFKKR